MTYLKIDKLPEIEPNPPKNPPMIKIRGLLHRDRGQDRPEETEKAKEKRLEKERKRERKRKATEEFIRSKREK